MELARIKLEREEEEPGFISRLLQLAANTSVGRAREQPLVRQPKSKLQGT
jgi:hypothetical protein